MSERLQIYLRQLETAQPPELRPGPREGVWSTGEVAASLKEAEQKAALSSPTQELVRALILLWHDHLEPAHQIAQGIETRDGSYVHALMHRREPDYSNAKYWFRKVGQHPAYRILQERVQPLLSRSKNRNLRAGAWDAYAFVDACEEAADPGHPEHALLREVQAVEFKVLLEALLEAT